MFLRRVEIQGFKSFANKTAFDFLPPKNSKSSITAVVGPNGSGKSNLADAIRWVLGEQSMKLLRGKKSEDVIFAGSDKKARLGFAEVTLFLDQVEPDISEYAEIALTRRLYRDGNTEYFINSARARLTDIQMLLAKARFGQKTYTVIGQGLIDQILLVSPRERKEFFDEAAGVKEFQLKRHQALLKLQATRENIAQAESVVREIEPRVRSLARAVKRLEEREEMEGKLRGLQCAYFGTVWHNLARYLQDTNKKIQAEEEKMRGVKGEYDALLAALHSLEVAETQSEAIIGLQREYEKLNSDRQKLRDQELQLKTALEVQRVRAETKQAWAPLPLTKIIEELEELKLAQAGFMKRLRGATTLGAMNKILDEFEVVAAKVEQLVRRLQRPAPEVEDEQRRVAPADSKAQNEITDLQASILLIDEQLKALSVRMHEESHREQEKKSTFFDAQRKLQAAQHVLHGIETAINNLKIDGAKFETRAESLREEMRLEIPELMEAVMKTAPAESVVSTDQAAREIFNLKHQLELAGGIDPEVMKEFEETKTRFDFLTTQLTDLNAALVNTESAIKDFDEVLKTRREEALKILNVQFQNFFTQLFGGGTAKLIPQYVDPRELEQAAAADDDEDDENEEDEEVAESAAVSREPVLVGIDIHAQPPGKRIKDISILSGGERAMTSVALICAIMASNPAPFVVLDEVDAALDEANSIRFANIVDDLAAKTQFIVITHNRATMAKGDILYGVTMGDDGVSQLLSVKFEEAARWAKG